MPRHAHKIGLARIRKTILSMLGMGIVCVFIAAHLYSFAIRVGFSPSTAARLPGYGFFVGLILGIAIRTVRSVKDIFAGLLAIVVSGGLLWVIGVVVSAFLVAFGLDPDIASWISPIAFWLGALIGSIALYAALRELADSLYQRLKSGFGGSPPGAV